MSRVSIVMPSMNSRKYLERSIVAFLEQDYANKRLIIVDGKSTDGSHEIIKNFAQRNSQIAWIKYKDSGISDAINHGLDIIENDEIFGFLGADDIMLQGTISTVNRYLSENPHSIGVFFDSISQDSDGNQKSRQCPSPSMTMSNLLKHRTIAGAQNTFLKAYIAKRYKYDTSMKYAMDYELYLRLAQDGFGEKIHHIPIPSTININDGNISTTFRQASKSEAIDLAYKFSPRGWQKLKYGVKKLTGF